MKNNSNGQNYEVVFQALNSFIGIFEDNIRRSKYPLGTMAKLTGFDTIYSHFVKTSIPQEDLIELLRISKVEGFPKDDVFSDLLKVSPKSNSYTDMNQVKSIIKIYALGEETVDDRDSITQILLEIQIDFEKKEFFFNLFSNDHLMEFFDSQNIKSDNISFIGSTIQETYEFPDWIIKTNLRIDKEGQILI